MTESPSVPSSLAPAVAIVGAGPSGLRAAAELARRGTEVLVLERESSAGGIPRHSDHLGYGMRDLKRFVTGPTYARILRESAAEAGARIMTNAMVTGWSADGGLEVTSPEGRTLVRPGATILATGARERSRAGRRVAGDRAVGIYTTGQLQNLVHLHGRSVGRRAVVVGAELVSWSAVMTLREAGCQTVLVTTEHPQPDAYRLFSIGGRLLFRTSVACSTRVVRVFGRPRVQGVEIEDMRTGARRTVECDTVVFTGSWVPDHELAHRAGAALDPRSLSPQVDAALRTSIDGVFGIGNLVHPVDTADGAALDGAHVVPAVLAHLAGDRSAAPSVALLPGRGLAWLAPHRYSPDGPPPPRGYLLSWPTSLIPRPVVLARQGERVLGRLRTWWPAAPGRVFRVPSRLLHHADPDGGPVVVDVVR